MTTLFADPSVDLSFQITPSIALDPSVVVARFQSSTSDLAAENHAFFRRSLFERISSSKVSVIATGGTGHSPWPEGYIGCGMLAAAVTGGTFVAPSPDFILATLEFVANRSSGVVIIAVNHQNDELNVSEAVEKFKRMGSVCPVEVVAVMDEAVSPKGRRARGLAGAVFAIKLAGAVAEMGGSLTEVYNIARTAAASVVTYATASVTCSATGRDVEMLNNGKVELGVGIHGESGGEYTATPSFSYPFDFVEDVCARVYGTLDARLEGMSCKKEGTVLMLNNLGSMSPTEMLIIRQAVCIFANERDISSVGENRTSLPTEIYSGCFMSSLGAIGFSVSGLAVLDKRWIELLHANTNAQGWKTASCVRAYPRTGLPFTADFRKFALVTPRWTWRKQGLDTGQVEPSCSNLVQNFLRHGQSISTESSKSVQEKCVLSVADALLSHAEKLTELDRRHGNQSLGRDAMRLGEALTKQSNLSEYSELAKSNPVEILNRIGQTARAAMQGSFGKFIQVFLTEMASFLVYAEGESKTWRHAFAHGFKALSQWLERLQGPQMTDRTMMAALEPVAYYLPQRKISLSDACAAAWDACWRTRNAQSSPSDRSGAINATHLKGVEDPGAYFVCVCLDAIKEVLEPCDSRQELDTI